MANIELDFEEDLIAVDDHNRQRRLLATRDGTAWRLLEGPIDGAGMLSQRATVGTDKRVLVETLRWLAENAEE